MTEYSRMAKGRFTSTGLAQVVQIPFIPDYVELFNYSASLAAPAANAVVSAKWDANMGQGFAVEQVYDSTPNLAADVVISNGITSYAAGQLLLFGASLQIASITKASPAVVTTASPHGYASGDVVMFQGLYSTQYTAGMPQISNIPFTVTVTGATTFTIPWNTNTSEYTALTGSPAGAMVKKCLYPYIYFPGVNIISAITTGTTTTIDTTSAHNFYLGQEVGFHIPTPWGTTQLNGLPNTNIPGSFVYGVVVAVTDYNTVVVNIDSTGYTAFNTNQTVASIPGLNYPQIVAVGDFNTGGVQVSAGSKLYPSPVFRPISNSTFSTINGPAIQGAFVNNTAQGFVVGAGAGSNQTSSVLVGANGNIIYWRAFLHDIQNG